MGVGQGGGGLFVELARIFWFGLVFGKMLFRRGGYAILFRTLQEWAFWICMG